MEQKKEVFSLEPVTGNKELLGASIEKDNAIFCLSLHPTQPEEQHFIKHVLAFFAASDGIVNENLVG